MREAVAHLQACHGMSERRACRVIDADRKSVRYRSTRDDDAGLREKLRELANQRRRFGYRRLHILLRREGVMINRKKTQRIYQEEGLAVRRRRSRRRAVGTRAPAPVLALPNQRWSLDFVHDQMASGRRFRVLNVVDDVTRECLAAVPDTSISGRRVVRELTELIARRGKPGMIVSDNDGCKKLSEAEKRSKKQTRINSPPVCCLSMRSASNCASRKADMTRLVLRFGPQMARTSRRFARRYCTFFTEEAILLCVCTTPSSTRPLSLQGSGSSPRLNSMAPFARRNARQ